MKKLILLALLAGLVLIPSTVQAMAPAAFDVKSYKVPAVQTLDAVVKDVGTGVVAAIAAEQKFVTDLIAAYKKSTSECGVNKGEVEKLNKELKAANDALDKVLKALAASQAAIAAEVVKP